MADVDIVLDANRAAVNDLIAAAEKCGSRWTAPRAPGKWSPSQVVEHVALALEESAHVVSGEPSKFPSLPAFVRPLVRGLVFKRVLKKNAFPKAKTNKAMNPASGPATTAEARGRLDGAFAKFERACRERAAQGQTVESTVFGTVSVEDYARFMALHTRHHCKQVVSAD
ncbi:MAG TPA: DinB family protein [Vicinamibacterales bacterium]|nr:DinB family protein [Vicinamibacterales bacterium]